MIILSVTRRRYPREARPGEDETYAGWAREGYALTVVLVAGDFEDYAAYAGQGSDEWVGQHGVKLSFQEACVHFPAGQLDASRYRP